MSSGFVLAGATELRPLKQCSLSKLCGLYSLLNAIQLALYPLKLSQTQMQELYLRAIAHLAKRRVLKRVLGVGMYEDIWVDLGNALLRHVNDTHGTALVLRQSFTAAAAKNRKRAIERIKADVRKGSPVLLSLGHTLDHYTVVCGHSRTRLKFFDSSGFRYVATENVGIGERSGRLHWIYPETTFTMIDDW